MLWASKTAINKRVYHSLARRAICVEITNLMVIQILSPTVLRLMSRHLTPVKYVNREKTLSVQYSVVFSHLHDWVIIRNPQIICWGCPGCGRSPCSNILVTITITSHPAHNIYCYSGTSLSTTLHLHQPPPWLTNKNRTSWTSYSCFSTQTDVESRSICHMSLSGI